MPRQEERETVINFTSIGKMASLYTSQPEVWRRLERLDGFKLLDEGKIDGKVAFREFEFPRSFVRFGKRGLTITSPKKPRPVSASQREALKKGRLAPKSLDVDQGFERSDRLSVVEDVEGGSRPKMPLLKGGPGCKE